MTRSFVIVASLVSLVLASGLANAKGRKGHKLTDVEAKVRVVTCLDYTLVPGHAGQAVCFDTKRARVLYDGHLVKIDDRTAFVGFTAPKGE